MPFAEKDSPKLLANDLLRTYRVLAKVLSHNQIQILSGVKIHSEICDMCDWNEPRI